jgi:hypothetical protein
MSLVHQTFFFADRVYTQHAMSAYIDEFLGGLQYNTEKTVMIYGGEAEDDKVVLCDWRVVFNVRNKMLDWKLFVQTYFTRDQLDAKHHERFYSTLRDVLGLKKEVQRKEIPKAIREILTVREDVLIRKLKKDFESHKCLALAMSELHVLLVQLFEQRLLKYVEERNAYIDRHKTSDHKNSLKRLYDVRSSELLLPAASSTKSDAKMHLNLATDDAELADAIKQFLFSLRRYKHVGPCPHFPVRRIKALLQFPFSELEECLSLLDNSYKATDFGRVSKIVSSASRALGKDVRQIKKMYQVAKTSSSSSVRIKQPAVDDIPAVKKQVDLVLQRYSKLFERIRLLEKFYDALAKYVSRITKELRTSAIA